VRRRIRAAVPAIPQNPRARLRQEQQDFLDRTLTISSLVAAMSERLQKNGYDRQEKRCCS